MQLLRKTIFPTFNFLKKYKFSTQLVQKSQSKLLKALSKELSHEKDNYEELKESKDIFKNNGFELIDKENSGQIELKKKIDNVIVSVKFNYKSPQPEEEDQEEQQEDNYHDFVINIVKENVGISVDCQSVQGEMDILNISHIYDYQFYLSQNKYDRHFNSYMGPAFQTLEEVKIQSKDIQEQFNKYLEQLGINKDVIQSIESYSEDKELRLYIKWLENVGKFVQL